MESAVQMLRNCLDGLRRSEHENIFTAFLCRLAEILASTGRSEASRAAIDEALGRMGPNGSFWLMPDALRIKGEVLELSGETDAVAAEDYFRRYLDLAARQGALSLQLRTAISLGRLYHARGRARDARQLLKSVYAQFTEGFETADLRKARDFLESWPSR
jgi:predicted ATPase